MRTRILQKHKKGCSAMGAVARGVWKSPWGLFQESKAYYGDSIGRRRGYRRWIVAICNAVDCPARIAVNEGDIMDELPHE